MSKFKECNMKYNKFMGSNVSVTISFPKEPTKSVMCVPMNNDNMDYQDILEWVAEGNTIEEAD